jgi:CheY-like chemotaxis protein
VTNKTILNVDDHAPARYLRTRILERAGFSVEEADTAAGAIELASASSLVLLDIKLPDGDGFSVCESVKKTTPKLPVVMVTSVYRTAEARRDGFSAGADAFLLEPIAPHQLIRVVEELVGKAPSGAAESIEVAWIVTDAVGEIQDISMAAARLLNLSQRGARGRSLPAFVVENRPRLMNDLLRAAEGLLIDRTTLLQPRDRRPFRVKIDLAVVPHAPGDRVSLQWTLVPEPKEA